MFGFIKQVIVTLLIFSGSSTLLMSLILQHVYPVYVNKKLMIENTI